jgi:hypothetical protein
VPVLSVDVFTKGLKDNGQAGIPLAMVHLYRAVDDLRSQSGRRLEGLEKRVEKIETGLQALAK